MPRAKKTVPDSKSAELKGMEKEITKSTKEFTKEAKRIGEKYGMILDIKVLINYKSENT